MNALGDLYHRIQYAGLAISSHDRHEQDIVAEQSLKRVEIDDPATGHRDRINLSERLTAQPPSRLPDRGVFHRGDKNPTPVRWPTSNNSAEGEIVGFGSPGCKNNMSLADPRRATRREREHLRPQQLAADQADA